jgi:hypothetical protein
LTKLLPSVRMILSQPCLFEHIWQAVFVLKNRPKKKGEVLSNKIPKVRLALSVLSLLPLPLDMNLLELIMGLCIDINLDMLLLPA